MILLVILMKQCARREIANVTREYMADHIFELQRKI